MNLRGRSLGKALRHMRTLAGLTQQEVAKEMGYGTAQFISNWERGISAPPDQAIGRLATVFGVKPTRLIDVIIDYEIATLKDRRRELVKMAGKRR